MNETNLYAVMTIMAFAVLLPISLLVETPKAVGSAINAAVAAGTSKKDLAILSALSGAYYYLYNEVAFLALGRVNPVTHAVGNTIKRVVIIIASVIAFNTPISRLGVIGSSIAITGTLLYLARQEQVRPGGGWMLARAPARALPRWSSLIVRPVVFPGTSAACHDNALAPSRRRRVKCREDETTARSSP